MLSGRPELKRKIIWGVWPVLWIHETSVGFVRVAFDWRNNKEPTRSARGMGEGDEMMWFLWNFRPEWKYVNHGILFLVNWKFPVSLSHSIRNVRQTAAFSTGSHWNACEQNKSMLNVAYVCCESAGIFLESRWLDSLSFFSLHSRRFHCIFLHMIQFSWHSFF